MISENDREGQCKLNIYNHLISNCTVLHNVRTRKGILEATVTEGRDANFEALPKMNPSLNWHINRTEA